MISKKLAFDWYLKLRMMAILAQILLLVISKYYLELTLNVWNLLLIISIIPITNLISYVNPNFDLDYKIASLLIIDVIILTFFLYSSGGYYNPLSTFYILQIILAGILVGYKFTWFITFLTTLSYLFLFKFYIPVPELEHHHGASNFHLNGMFVGFILLAILVSYFIVKIVAQLEKARIDLDLSQQKQKSIVHLASLNTLLASVAHELNTPLNTIYLAAHDLNSEYKNQDLDLIIRKINECKRIMDDLRLKSGVITAENFKKISLEDFAERLKISDRVRINYLENKVINLPVEASVKVFTGLIQNGLESSQKEVEVVINVNKQLRIEIIDYGKGMSVEELENIGQPFFTTKSLNGLGLGVYLAKSFIELLSGSVQINSKINEGTQVIILIPIND